MERNLNEEILRILDREIEYAQTELRNCLSFVERNVEEAKKCAEEGQGASIGFLSRSSATHELDLHAATLHKLQQVRKEIAHEIKIAEQK